MGIVQGCVAVLYLLKPKTYTEFIANGSYVKVPQPAAVTSTRSAAASQRRTSPPSAPAALEMAAPETFRG